MDNILNQIDQFDYNSTNSIVMGVLRSAMDKAHEKLQSKDDGPIEFLYERSKFYELSAILVGAVLNIIQEEIDDISEKNGEKIRLDLMEMEHWLQGRVEQTQSQIVEKDRELKEMIENESKLKQALDLKENELVHLREKLELEKSETGNEDFDEAKNSIDQQEEEEFSGFDSERVEQNNVIHQMSSDINILIGTLDFAFGKMHKAEILPLEKQWRWAIEKDIVSMLIRGFLNDIHQNVEAKLEEITNIFIGHNNAEMDKMSMVDSSEKLARENESLRQQCDDQKIQILLSEKIYQLLFQGLREGIGPDGCLGCLEVLIREDIYTTLYQEIIAELKEKIQKMCHCTMKEDLVNQECIANLLLQEKINGNVRNSGVKPENNDVSFMSSHTLETIKSLLEVDVCMVYLTEMARSWRLEIDSYHLENSFRDNIHQFVVIEVATGDRNRLAQNLSSSVNTYVDEDGMHHPKSLDISQRDLDLHSPVDDNSPPRHQWGSSEYLHVKNIKSALKIPCTISLDFDESINNFGRLVQEKVERNSSRIVDLKHQTLEILALMVTLKKESSLYKKAFQKRCQNLALAEAEVDLLGDEVDRLRNLLDTVHQVLYQNSVALSSYTGVTDLMKSIKKELVLV